jgi:hypothetical protein
MIAINIAKFHREIRLNVKPIVIILIVAVKRNSAVLAFFKYKLYTLVRLYSAKSLIATFISQQGKFVSVSENLPVFIPWLDECEK